ncbi:DUF4199 domain-containing protein [Sinomicrobium pectinilyticum]|uniref:DUF4199 domain-containing protein n=1 Tax=Sinomicrobium pectinilyticum TaxID=1084421 RepID=A0A3N0EH95_SINP1|nr:DUF4199 domain-containing protein [Sinomicrobium pectinilyticum]RNL87256.1 DUF4199 domain-containing protein [Sinomicrobium pectinilyticum]
MKDQTISFRYGSIVGIALIAYFLLLSLIGLHIQPVFSVMNIVITGAGIYLVIKNLKKLKGEKFRYQHGFSAGLVTGFTATAVCAVFFALYIIELNPGFTDEFMTMWKFDWFAKKGMLILTVILMGAATTMVLTLAFMQLFKDSWNTKEGRKHTISKDKGKSEKHG